MRGDRPMRVASRDRCGPAQAAYGGKHPGPRNVALLRGRVARHEGLDRWSAKCVGLSRPRAERTDDDGCTRGAEEGRSRRVEQRESFARSLGPRCQDHR